MTSSFEGWSILRKIPRGTMNKHGREENEGKWGKIRKKKKKQMMENEKKSPFSISPGFLLLRLWDLKWAFCNS